MKLQIRIPYGYGSFRLAPSGWDIAPQAADWEINAEAERLYGGTCIVTSNTTGQGLRVVDVEIPSLGPCEGSAPLHVHPGVSVNDIGEDPIEMVTEGRPWSLYVDLHGSVGHWKLDINGVVRVIHTDDTAEEIAAQFAGTGSPLGVWKHENDAFTISSQGPQALSSITYGVSGDIGDGRYLRKFVDEDGRRIDVTVIPEAAP